MTRRLCRSAVVIVPKQAGHMSGDAGNTVQRFDLKVKPAEKHCWSLDSEGK